MRFAILLILFFWFSHEVETVIKVIEYDKLNTQLIDMGVKFPEVFQCQVFLESNKMTSLIYKENNNLIGMKKPIYRPTTAIGVNRGHAVYASVEDCIRDYVLYQEYWMPRYEESNGKIETAEDYIVFLNTVGYAEDTAYKKKLNKILLIYKKLKKIT